MSKIQFFNVLTLITGGLTILFAIFPISKDTYHLIPTFFLILALIFNHVCHSYEKSEIRKKQKELK